jgi:hypothetical protein
MKRIYFSVLYVIVNLFAVFGLLLPYLFSEASDLAVILGIVILLADVTHLIFFIKNLIVKSKN